MSPTTPLPLAGKSALVTGAARSIGAVESPGSTDYMVAARVLSLAGNLDDRRPAAAMGATPRDCFEAT